MAASGAILREVGTTNRTRVGDYARAINPQTAALMHVHTSNYKVVGFVEETPTAELANLAGEHGLVLLDDIGSGAMVELSRLGLPAEPWFRGSLEAGADLVLASGDKLLGGPQAGIIAGRKDLVDQIVANPLMRTYRVCKLTLAALEATLRLYQDPDQAVRAVPALQRLCEPYESLRRRADALAQRLQPLLPDAQVEAAEDSAWAGGGALPACELPTATVRVRFQGGRSPLAVARALRSAEPPVVGRVAEDALVLDLRSVLPGQEDWIVRAFERMQVGESPS
jgi:L-seryl-tRNA(Ser) seleniumtransferase